jgi:hypothetical protein
MRRRNRDQFINLTLSPVRGLAQREIKRCAPIAKMSESAAGI